MNVSSGGVPCGRRAAAQETGGRQQCWGRESREGARRNLLQAASGAAAVCASTAASRGAPAVIGAPILLATSAITCSRSRSSTLPAVHSHASGSSSSSMWRQQEGVAPPNRHAGGWRLSRRQRCAPTCFCSSTACWRSRCSASSRSCGGGAAAPRRQVCASTGGQGAKEGAGQAGQLSKISAALTPAKAAWVSHLDGVVAVQISRHPVQLPAGCRRPPRGAEWRRTARWGLWQGRRCRPTHGAAPQKLGAEAAVAEGVLPG